MTLPHVSAGQPHVAAHNAERDAINALEGATAQVALPVTGVTIVEQFVFNTYSVARPTVPSYVSLNWIGPAGPGGIAPTHMATGDTWDLEV